MTRLQRMLYAIGFARFKRYRRWVGGCWIERYIEATVHSSEVDHWRWEPHVALDDSVPIELGQAAGRVDRTIEQWPSALPQAHARQLK